MAKGQSRTPKDTYSGQEQSVEGPARFATTINPGDTLSISPRSVYVGIGGNVFCRPMGYANNVAGVYGGGEHANQFFYNVVPGTILPLRMDRIWVRNESDISQNTTASQLVGLW